MPDEFSLLTLQLPMCGVDIKCEAGFTCPVGVSTGLSQARLHCRKAVACINDMFTAGATCDDILVIVENEAVERMGWEGETDHCNRCLSVIDIRHVSHHFC